MIILMIARVYFDGNMPLGHEAVTRTTTLAGTIFDQISYGVLADVYGRRKMG
jgi:hypothetical protein